MDQAHASAIAPAIPTRSEPTVPPPVASISNTAEGASPSRLRRLIRWTGSMLDWLFGCVALIFGLAALSVIPVLNFFSLGYLLQASARVADAKGKLHAGFIGVRKAAVLGRIVIGAWLFILPVRFVASMWRDAELIAPGSPTATAWHVGLIILTVLVVAHIVWACIRGGKVQHFLWPAPLRFVRWIGRSGTYTTMRDTTLDYLASLRLPHYLWLGARGFAGAVIWLIIPVGILIAAGKLPPGGAAVVSLVGAALLMAVVLYLPFLQTHFAQQNRFAALFEVKVVRGMFRRAPIAFWIALLITLLFALPLYLLKIQLTPREVAWLPSLLFVIFIFPARLLSGWAVGRAERRELPRNWVFRWAARLAALPVVAAYALIVFLTQYLSWHGSLSLLEQHAFLVPAPLMGL